MDQTPARHFLLPGDIAFSTEEAVFSTLLGSCVSVCLHDTRLKIGGMNHYMLPSRVDSSMRLSAGKYGDNAIRRLLAMAAQAGSRAGDLVASVYGGGNVAGHLGSLGEVGLFDIGRRNVETAFAGLKGAGIRVLRHDTGGSVARKIHMDVRENRIELTRVERSQDSIERERKLTQFRKRKIRVLVVDDSQLVRKILRAAINASGDMEVYAEAADPFEAREHILADDPDVVCLDVIMPRMDGITFLKKLMGYKYIPTVIVSTMVKEGTSMKDKALAAGAFAAVDKDALCIYNGFERLNAELLPALRNAASTVRHG